MSRPVAFCLVLVGLALLRANAQQSAPAADTTPQETSESQPTAAPDDPAGARLTEDEIHELDRIRRSLGNSPLRDSKFLNDDVKAMDRAEFSRQLRRDFGVSGTERHDTPEAADQVDPAKVYRQRALRSLSRRLDAISLDLQELRYFDDADQLRELSERLLHQARD